MSALPLQPNEINPLIGDLGPGDTLSNCTAVLQLVGVVVTTFGSDGADGLGEGPKAGLHWALNCVEGALLYEIEAKRPWAGGEA
jgi:hypothetical protein